MIQVNNNLPRYILEAVAEETLDIVILSENRFLLTLETRVDGVAVIAEGDDWGDLETLCGDLESVLRLETRVESVLRQIERLT